MGINLWFCRKVLITDIVDTSMFSAEQKRIQKLRLGWFEHTQEKTYNIAKTCRYYGISRQTYYKWLWRYNSLGKKGLVNQSKRPLNTPPPQIQKYEKSQRVCACATTGVALE
ncbi:MAG: helix-turn-helix domain-containing protein [Candidatus Yanofskybacteria bacterium]|nr:helix-turn-helix domain-containing protein [Candidatus Yanofskybacteria bacterium]